MAGRPEPRTTSRFDTRVDYMFSSEVDKHFQNYYESKFNISSSQTFNKNWSLENYGHFPYDASDHSFVVADFSRL